MDDGLTIAMLGWKARATTRHTLESWACADLFHCGDEFFVYSNQRDADDERLAAEFGVAGEMVIERLDATLPDSYFSAPAPVDAAARRVVPQSAPATPAPATPSPVATLKNALQGGEQFKELLPTVAGCTIRGLRISRRTDGTNVVPWLTATRASAARGGLRLQDVRSVENGVTNSWSEAFLALEPKLELRHP